MFRAFHPQSVSLSASTLTLDVNESGHLVRSLRAKAGEKIRAFNGTGVTWEGVILDANPRALTMQILSRKMTPPASPKLALAQSLPKGGLFDDIVRDAVAIGVSAIFPLASEHCEVHLDDARAAAKLERWQTIAIEACKQSGNIFLPQIFPPVPLRKFLAQPRENFLCLAGSLENDAIAISQITLPSPAPETLLILIGPEGDFSPDEYAEIRKNNFHAVRFGENVLRVPTAANYGLVALDQLRQRRVLPRATDI